MSVVSGDELAAEQEPQADKPRPPRRTWKLILAGLVTCFVVLGGYDLISSASLIGVSPASPASARSTAPTSPAAPAAMASPAVTARVPVSARASVAAGGLAPGALTVASVAAFGPQGTSDGDNPGTVSRINSGGSQPWYTAWYATPEFGNLMSGTGLLFDMGGEVTVSRVRLTLGPEVGADVQIWVGDTPSMAAMTVVAEASDAGGTVQLPATTPVIGHYVLVWFTRLPPDAQGHYQVAVYRAVMDGTAAR